MFLVVMIFLFSQCSPQANKLTLLEQQSHWEVTVFPPDPTRTDV